MTEKYSLILSSQNTNNIVDSTNKNKIQYLINWNSILPVQYKKFNVSFQLITKYVATPTTVLNISSVGVNFGSSNTKDQTSSTSTILGFLNQVSTYRGSVVGFQNVGFPDNTTTTICYPTNSIITVSILDVDLTQNTQITDYILKLHFEPIE